MMKIKNFKILFLLACGLFSCETILDEIPSNKLFNTEPQIVIASFISPQDTEIYVKITESSPLFTDYKTSNAGFIIDNGDTLINDNSNVLNDAVVSISNGTQTEFLTYDKKLQIYKISALKFPLRGGLTYTLKAQSKGRTAQSTCIIPARRAQIQNFSIDSTSQSGFGFSRKGYKVQFKWTDIANQADSYRVRAYIEFEYLEPTIKKDSGVVFEKKIGRTAANWNGRFTDTDAYIEDLNQDGMTMQSPVGTIFPNLPNRTISYKENIYSNKFSDKKPKFVIELLSIEENYKKYHLSIIKHENAENNPFAEPYSVYSNIKGGLGCFGASNRRIVTIIQ